jgi:hypothetical protein
MKRYGALCVLGSLLAASAAQAGVTLSAGGGYTRCLAQPVGNGFGVDASAGYDLPFYLTPELELGWHRYAATKAGVHSSNNLVPVLLGAREQVPLPALGLQPFAGAHVGLMHIASSSGSVQFTPIDKLALNVGLGADVVLGPSLRVGVGGWYWLILAGGKRDLGGGIVAKNANIQLLAVGIDVRTSLLF